MVMAGLSHICLEGWSHIRPSTAPCGAIRVLGHGDDDFVHLAVLDDRVPAVSVVWALVKVMMRSPILPCKLMVIVGEIVMCQRVGGKRIGGLVLRIIRKLSILQVQFLLPRWRT